jgi:hypothetical protein
MSAFGRLQTCPLATQSGHTVYSNLESKLNMKHQLSKDYPMTIDELQGVLRAEKNIKENVWAIEPESVPDGVLGLKKIEDGRWQVILNERGLRLINRTFQNESDACRFFLKSVLDDSIFWTPVPSVGDTPYAEHLTRHIELLAKYGFERGEGDTHFGYLLIFAILFIGISIAPLFVMVHSSFLWGLMATLAYVLGWVFGFKFRDYRFINYRFGWGTVGHAVYVYHIAGGLVALLYTVGLAGYVYHFYEGLVALFYV